MATLITGVRSVIFYIGYILLVIWFGGTGFVFFSFLPYHIRAPYVLNWNRLTMAWLRVTCGLGVNVIGAENLPPRPYVALAKHSSQWETYFLQYYLRPVSIVLKKELLRLPFFGWGLKLARPIAIDRGNPKQAIRDTMEKGKAILADDISLLIFPEGTRKQTGPDRKYARGGAGVAIAANVPIVPIAHNASVFWPADRFLKYPGRITVKIGEPLYPQDGDSRELTERVKQWIEAEVAQMQQQP